MERGAIKGWNVGLFEPSGSEKSKLHPLLQPLNSSWSQNELEKNVSICDNLT